MRRPPPSLAVVAALLTAPVWAALGPRYGGEVTIGVPALPALDGPAAGPGCAERTLQALVHETLVRQEAGGPTPGLARAFSPSPDGLEWTLTLAPARFHDGAAFTSADAVRSLQRFLRSGSPAAERLAAGLVGGRAFRDGAPRLAGLAAPDESHVVLRFASFVAAPLAPLASPAAAVTSPGGAGAGPFVPGARSARRLDLAAFAEHPRGRAFLDRVALQVADGDDPPAELAAGRVQVALGGEPSGPPAATLLLLLDPRSPPFDRAGARAAAIASVDSGELIDHLLPGGERPTGLLVPALLAGPGSAAPAARVPLSGGVRVVVSREVPPAVSQRVVACLADLGLDAQAQPVEPGGAPTAPAGARVLWWSPEVAEPGLALRELSGLASAGPAVVEALDAADRERDPDRRRALLQRAEAALRETALIAPLAVVPLPWRARPEVHGLRSDLSGAVVFEDAWREP